MKKPYLAPALMLIIGGVAAYLKQIVTESSFEEFTGLLKRGDKPSFILCVITAAVVFGALVFGFAASRKFTAHGTYPKAYKNNSLIAMALSCVAGIVFIGVAAYSYLYGDRADVVNTVFCALAGASGLGIVLLSVNAFTGRKNSFVGLSAIAPCLFFTFWLALYYKDHAAEPTLMSYCFFCFTLASAAVSFYYLAGAHYGRMKVFGAVASHLLCVYFSAVALGENMGLSVTALAAGTALFMSVSATTQIRNLKQVKNDDFPVK